jgi:NADH:ubiquinone oxidoreductase subunit 5 (subunit L)/multisubunit Na+/H+ antiporter MnhA subunit
MGFGLLLHSTGQQDSRHLPALYASVSYSVEVLLFMGVMLCYGYTVSLYLLVVLWEWLGVLSFLLIQH